MTDAYYPGQDPGIMDRVPRATAAPGPFSERTLSVERSFAYRAACAAQGVEFTDRDGNRVLDKHAKGTS